MGGITQCMECGDLYYGDERDGYATCRCVEHDEEAKRRRLNLLTGDLRDIDARIDALSQELRVLREGRSEIVDTVKSLTRANPRTAPV